VPVTRTFTWNGYEVDGVFDLIDLTPPEGSAVPLSLAIGFQIGAVRAPASPPAPSASFTGTPLTGNAALSVTFTDASTGTPTSWLWEKNSGSGWVNFAGTPTAQNPTESFAAGTWSVRLTATNAGGSDTQTRTNYLTASSVSPSVRGTATAGNGAPTLPAHQTGDVLVVACAYPDSAIDPTASGWTRRLRSGSDGGNQGLCVFTKTAASGAETITPTTAPEGYVAYAVKDAAAVDTSGTVAGGNGTTPSCAAVTATAAGVLLDFICCDDIEPGGGTITMPAGETASPQSNPATAPVYLRGGSKAVAAGAASARTGSLPSFVPWVTGTVVVK